MSDTFYDSHFIILKMILKLYKMSNEYKVSVIIRITYILSNAKNLCNPFLKKKKTIGN